MICDACCAVSQVQLFFIDAVVIKGVKGQELRNVFIAICGHPYPSLEIIPQYL
jgi:hypothetical protein